LKNLKYFPFERNRYFYGKLLTVEDFEQEQKYMNDKRRLVNRFLHGCGVICGMHVIQVDDTTVSVEMGAAIDFSGREIIIDTPVIKKLHMIEGFDVHDDADAGYLYICVEYAENNKEPVLSIASSGVRSADQAECNKVSEGYRMFLTAQEPQNEAFTPEHFYQDSRTVFWANGIRVRQILPKYVRSSGEAELKVIVENMGQQQPFAFSYEVELSCLSLDGARRFKVSFDEKDHVRSGSYELSFHLTAASVKGVEGKAAVLTDSLTLSVADRPVKAASDCISSCAIADSNVKSELIRNYYKTAMEEIVKNTYQQSIYLARIRIIRAAQTYVIEGIEQTPFRQHVWSGALAAAVNDITMGEVELLQSAGCREQPASSGAPAAVPETYAVSTGSVVFDLGIGGRKGQKFFSGEISHGLGLGPVTIVLGEAVTVSDDSDRVYGDPTVFEDQDDKLVTSVKLAAKTDLKKGTFIIGLVTTTPANAGKLRIDWTAIRDRRQAFQDAAAKLLLIKPDMADIEVRDTCLFEAVFSGVTDRRVRWAVSGENSGEIDANGMYTAPNVAGVYEVTAASLAYPELTASTYVVVREGKTGSGRLL
jgi:hypothetical protein